MPKLSILPNVLFDEFPNDENYKVRIQFGVVYWLKLHIVHVNFTLES